MLLLCHSHTSLKVGMTITGERLKKEKNKMKSKTSISLTALVALIVLLSVAWPVFAVPPGPLLLDPKAIPKFVNQLTGPPPVYAPNVGTANEYTIDATQFTQQILPPGFPTTKVWGYGGTIVGGTYLANAPGATFEAVRGVPIKVTWQNKLDGSHLLPVDPTLHWANPNNIPMPDPLNPLAPVAPFPPYDGITTFGFDGTVENPPGTGLKYNAQSPVPLVPHLHGGEVQSTSDGHPEAWFTSASSGLFGMEFSTNDIYQPTTPPPTPGEAVFNYPNEQPPTTLWYHDHALGITRINVLSGLAGFYLLRGNVTNPTSPYYDAVEAALVASAPFPYNTPEMYRQKYEMPLVIQDRTFRIDGSFFFDTLGVNPNIHPYWTPEFFGNTIMVNGKVWPYMNVDRGVYRLRILDGSNARFYTLSFVAKNKILPFDVIGSDGGYLQQPAIGLKEITIGPGERIDILVDFSGLNPGDTVLLKNTASAPFKGPAGGGTPADPQTVGQIMQFRVPLTPTPGPSPINYALLTPFNPTLPVGAFPTLLAGTQTPTTNPRILTLVEVMGAGGPLAVLLDGQKWMNPVSENPVLGSTEEWVIVNPTADTHPIHLHLVQFQLVSRQPFRAGPYLRDWMKNNGMAPLMGTPVWPGSGTNGLTNLAPYLQKTPVVPGPGVFTTEQGWKDTIQVNPGEVTTIRIRFAPIDQTTPDTPYPFDATTNTPGPGYVWHCHILDHEDNEMMRPYIVQP